MNQDPRERRRRHLPTWKRLGFEYLVLIAVYIVAWLVSGELVVAFVAMIVAMIGLRMTRARRNG